MEPKLSQPFTSWKRPEINLEFDHRGAFKELPNIRFFYEGGESKLSFNGTIHKDEINWQALKGARLQLENRFRLIDAVANLGFMINCDYVGKVYIPQLPTNISDRKSNKPIRFLRYENSVSPNSKNASKEKQSQIVELTRIDSVYLLKVEAFDTPSYS